jgi:biotin synthase
MMARWGLDGMRSFEQVSVAKKEGTRIGPIVEQSSEISTSSSRESEGHR